MEFTDLADVAEDLVHAAERHLGPSIDPGRLRQRLEDVLLDELALRMQVSLQAHRPELRAPARHAEGRVR
jgi:hypothetical protein